MSNLAIKGHKHRGKEVIQILEMLGGKNVSQHKGNSDKLYIIQDGEIHLNFTTFSYCFKVFTIEEFFEKFPYKVGDKVKYINNVFFIKSLQWDSDKNTIIYYIDADWSAGYVVEADELQPHKEQETMEEQTYLNPKANKEKEKIKESLKDAERIMKEQIKINIPKGYEFAGVDDDAHQVVFEKIGYQYPKTYEECCDVLNIETNRIIEYDECLGYRDITQYDTNLLTQLEYFRRLRICRDAYWKLADWSFKIGNHDNSTVYAITIFGNGILKDFYHALNCNRVLVFPTEEMRDEFYKNFKNLIEKCKELL